MIATQIRRMGQTHWIVLYALILGAWAVLYAMAIPADLRAASALYGLEFLASLCVATPDAAGFAGLVVMWAMMSAAMMAPTALPALATYDDLAVAGAQTRLSALVAGYLTIWLGFSVFAAAAQLALFGAGLIDPFGSSLSTGLSVGLLAIAGVYQFTPMKDACLSKCRAPMMFFLQHFDEGPWRNGLRLGAVCLGCCWALMLLGFVGGVMNLAFMGVATVLMALEKLPVLGRWLTRPMGVGLLAAAAVVAATGF
jgi:predicted metal-binding membrane protein